MGQKKEDIELGRFLSLLLRHRPEAAGIVLDSNGYADVEELLAGVNRTGRKIDRETLNRIVKENDKKRYHYNADGTKIRASQGHSLPVNLSMTAKKPPDILYHGTAARFLDSIREKGIVKQTRQYVHLSETVETAKKVGRRHGVPVVLAVDACRMAQDGFPFFLSENGVWLCDFVPWRYIQEIEE